MFCRYNLIVLWLRTNVPRVTIKTKKRPNRSKTLKSLYNRAKSTPQVVSLSLKEGCISEPSWYSDLKVSDLILSVDVNIRNYYVNVIMKCSLN
jgi:hypothetical protein